MKDRPNLRMRIARKLIPKPPDAPRRYKGTAPGDPDAFRVLRFGDCAWRECDYGHNLGRRPGYPEVLGDRLAARGIPMEFDYVYQAQHQQLPATLEELERYVRLSGEPDLVVLQLSTGHAVRTVLPIRPLWNDARIHLAHRTGPLSLPVYWVMHKVLRRWGRSTPFPGTDHLDRFWALVAERWPDAERVMLSPLCRAYVDGFIDVPKLDVIWPQIAARCRELGVTVVDSYEGVDALRERLGRRAVNAFNGYDLRRPGHEAITDLLVEVLEPRLRAREARAPEPSVAA